MNNIFVGNELRLAKNSQKLEVETAKLEKLNGLLEYTAMMADVELPEDEEQGDNADE